MEIIRNHFTYNKKTYRVVQFRGGKLEVYKVEDDGLEMFQGYLYQVNIDLSWAAWDAFQKAPGQRWLFAA